MKSLLIASLFMLILVPCAPAAGLLTEADEVYSMRGENFNPSTLKVDATYINRALALYLQAFEQSSGAAKEEACWKYIRACYFKGRYVETEKEAKKDIFDLGKNIGIEGLKEFPESVGIHAWMAIIWGVWGEENGIIQSARKGVAGKIRDHCEKTIELDEMFYDATGYRILAMLHFKAPKIPIILGWPSKEKAFEYIQKAYQLSPRNLNTQQYLAEILHHREQDDRANELLREILATNETVLGTVEDAFVKKTSSELLKEWNE